MAKIRFLGSTIAPFLSLVVMGLGCTKRQAAKTTVSAEQQKQESTAEAEALMDSVQSVLQRPAANSRVYDVAVKQLNEYLASHSESVPAVDPAFKDRVAKMLDPDAANAVDRKTFDEADADYLANSLFLQAIAKSQRREEDDLKYAERLFEWVARYIQLTPTGALPKGQPKEVCIRGNGDVDERAWVFLELLRQAGIPGCRIGVPKPVGDAPISLWLCGAYIGKELFLFDPRTGIPLPNEKGSTATLKELAANPGLADFLNLPPPAPPAPIQKADAKQFSLLIVLDPAMLSPRMRFLQERLSGVTRPNLYLDVDKTITDFMACLDGLPGNQGVRVWKDPLQVGERLRGDPQLRAKLLESLNLFWLVMPRSPRLLQLRGDHEAAIKELVKLDLEKTGDVLANEFASMRIPLDVSQRLISQTRQDIVYFLGLSKLDDSHSTPALARDWFDRYLEKYSSPELRLDDFVNWPLFAAEVAGLLEVDPKQPANPVAQMLRIKLSPASQQGVKTIANSFLQIKAVRNEIGQLTSELSKMEKEEQEAGGNERYRPEMDEYKKQIRVRREFIENTERPNAAIKQKILSELNSMLSDKSFFDPKAFAPLVARSDELKFMLTQDYKKFGPKETAMLNRVVFDSAFPAAVVKSQRYWLESTLRNRATSFARDNKYAEAAASIEKYLSEVAPYDRLGLESYVRLLKRQPTKSTP